MRRLTALLTLTLLLTIALPALANHAEDLTVNCDGWSANFVEFNFTDHELLVTINGLEVFYAVNPPDGDFTLSGPLPEGLDGTVTLATFWRHLQVNLDGPTVTAELDCTPDETTTTTGQETTTTVPQTTTTVQECAPGQIHQPPLCLDPTTTTVPTSADTTAPVTAETLPFTGPGNTTPYLALAGSLALILGLVFLMFDKRELR